MPLPETAAPPGFSLDAEQAAAVRMPASGRRVILAGAGAGKTKCLVARAVLTRVRQASHPGNVLCLTYARQSAAEIESRLQTLVESAGVADIFSRTAVPSLKSRFWTGTLHSLAHHLLEDLGETWHYLTEEDRKTLSALSDSYGQIARREVAVLEETQAEALWERCVTECVLAGTAGAAFTKWPRSGDDIMAIWASRLAAEVCGEGVPVLRHPLTPSEARRMLWGPLDMTEEEMAVANHYFLKKQAWRKIDHTDQLILAGAALRVAPAFDEHYRRAWSHVLIDEAQDISGPELFLLRQFPGFETPGPEAGRAAETGYTLIGDLRQEIHGYRGGPTGVLRSLVDGGWPDEVRRLTVNYRSGRAIVALGNRTACCPRLATDYAPEGSRPRADAPEGGVGWHTLAKGDSLRARMLAVLTTSLCHPAYTTRAILVRKNRHAVHVHDLLAEIAGGADGFEVMTVHRAKGREWDHVILPGLGPGEFPAQAQFGRTPEEHLQSEARLFYVAVTRARTRLDIFEEVGGAFHTALQTA